MFTTIALTTIIAVAVVAIVLKGIKNKREGKHTCSCGGNCVSCPMNCESK